MKEFIEIRILNVIRELLKGRVNELLSEIEYNVPLIEFSAYESSSVIVPVIEFTSCEQTEKERILRLDVYSLTITFPLPETSSLTEPSDSELICYVYSAAVYRAISEDITLDGIANRTAITSTKYIPPRISNCGQNWELVIVLRVIVEGTVYAC